MVQPYNYSVDVPQTNVVPYMAAIGQSLANQLAQYQAVQEQQRQAAMMAERQRQMQMQFAQDMRAYTQDPSAQNYTMILTRYPQLKDQMAKAHEAMSEEQRQAQLAVIQPAYAAFSSGDIGTATQILAERRTALQNAGKMAQAQNVDRLIRSIDENPNAARMQFHMVLGGLLGPEKAAESFKMFELMPTEMREAEAVAGTKEAEKAIKEKELLRWDERFAAQMNLDKATAYATRKNAQTQARKQGLEEEKFLFDVEQSFKKLAENTDYDKVPAPIKAEINKLNNSANQLAASSSQLLALAQAYEDGQVEGFGKASQLTESIKKFFGAEDPTTLVRLQYDLRRKVAAMQQLRGTGPVSNFELQTFLQGWPEGTADINVVTAFLRGQAKAAQIASSLEEAEAVWMANNQGVLGPAAGDMVIGGIPVERGMTFGDFQRKYGAALLSSFFPEKNEERNRARGYIK